MTTAAPSTTGSVQQQSPRGKPSHVAASTLMAADFLVKLNDPARLEAWLLEHSAAEREAICAYIVGKASE
jgi:hypothetical protein